jgi:hypothetical protein
MVNLSVRVSAQVKQQVEAAAGARGLTLQEFVLEALLTASKTRRRPAARARALELILGLLNGIRRRGSTMEGGRRGYRRVGFETARQCPNIVRMGGRWKETLAQLRNLLAARDPESSRTRKHLLDWCDRNLPKVMEQVPSRRRTQFIHGFLEAVDGGYARWIR